MEDNTPYPTENINESTNSNVNAAPPTQLQTELQHLSSEVLNIRREISKIIVGQDNLVTLLLNGLLAGGHVLIEGVPELQKHSLQN